MSQSALPLAVNRDFLKRVEAIALKAGRAVLEHYHATTVPEVEIKDDHSPLTEADLAADRIIVPALQHLTPRIPVVSEERAALCPAAPNGLFWLVDPLDGTREYIARTDEFTVNIALVRAGIPVLGVVVAPALTLAWSGLLGGKASEAWRFWDEGERHAIRTRLAPAEGLTVLASRRHGDPDALTRYLGGKSVAAFRQAGSSLKFCLLATGQADLYPRFGPTMEWDTAAGHAILLAAGGGIETLSGQPLTYAKAGLKNPPFLAWGRTNI